MLPKTQNKISAWCALRISSVMGRPRISIDQINEALAKAEVELIGCYSGRIKDKHTFKCSNNHIYTTAISSIIAGHKCRQCFHINRILSKNEVQKRIEHTGITILGKYKNTHSISELKCKNNHIWRSSVNSILKGSKCKKCFVESLKLNTKQINEKLSFKNIKMINEYTGNYHSKQTFMCNMNHTWSAELGPVLRYSGCPECSIGGFKKNKPAHAYIISFESFLKYGISNRLQIRLSEHQNNNGNCSILLSKYFQNGVDALNWEQEVKKLFGGNFVSKDMCPDGYTETLSLDFSESLMNHLRDYK